MGYDGNGVAIIRKREDLDFLNLNDQECIAEDISAISPMSLAVIVCEQRFWCQSKAYPVVEMEFHPEANQVEYVLCPARL